MQIIDSPISLQFLSDMAKKRFGNLIKGVVDIEKGCIALDADLHADLEAALLGKGSIQKNLWGVNLYPELFGSDDFVEFDSMINLRPSLGNMTRGVDDIDMQQNIRTVVSTLITP